MAKKDLFTKVLTLIGTVLVWLPLLAPVVFALLHFSATRRFQVDYLLPAELFPVALAGGGLLLWAALRARSHRAIIGAALGLAAGLLVGGQALAVISGLASGATEPDGWAWAVVLGSLVVYALALVTLGVGGGLLVRDLFQRPRLPTAHA